MLQGFPARWIARDSAVACFLFVLTASEIAAVFDSPAQWRPLSLVIGMACFLVSFIALLDAYYRLKDQCVLWNWVSLAWMLLLALPVLMTVILLLLYADVWFGLRTLDRPFSSQSSALFAPSGIRDGLIGCVGNRLMATEPGRAEHQ